jgi:hypothetical protein
LYTTLLHTLFTWCLIVNSRIAITPHMAQSSELLSDMTRLSSCLSVSDDSVSPSAVSEEFSVTLSGNEPKDLTALGAVVSD